MSEMRVREENTIAQGSKWSEKRQDQDKFYFLYYFAGVPSCKKYSVKRKAEDDLN